MVRYYQFADMTFRISQPEDLPIPANMKLFEVAEPEDSNFYSYNICVPDDEMETAEVQSRWADAVRYDREQMIVLEKDGLQCRQIFFRGAERPYAVTEEVSPTETHIWVSAEEGEMFRYDTIYASLFSFERRMLMQDALLLHCAYMKLGEEAVLFSAPSGTGKSTQADLWEKYRGTRTINGDAAILSKKKGRWQANGWSVCGSSEICHNESYPIRAIVMLFQARENTCRELSAMEAFRQLYPQIKVNAWSMDFQNQVFGLMDDLIGSVPILQLGCDISEDAVRCLEEFVSE